MGVGIEGDLPTRLEHTPETFEEFVAQDGERLRRVLVAHYGLDTGPDVAADALAWAWEHWDEVGRMENAVGYLYRVGQSSARRHRRWKRSVSLPPEASDDNERPPPEPGLDLALARLKAPQRVALLLVHGLDWTYKDAAAVMGISVAAITNHLHRGMARLRREMGEVE